MADPNSSSLAVSYAQSFVVGSIWRGLVEDTDARKPFLERLDE